MKARSGGGSPVVSILFSAVVFLVTVFLAGAVGAETVMSAKSSHRGVVRLSLPDSVPGATSRYEGTIALEGYSGKPLQAMQLLVVVQGGGWITQVLPGSALADNSRWLVSSVTPALPAATPATPDTVRVVILSKTGEGLAAPSPQELLWFTFALAGETNATRVTFRLSDVLGAIATGEKAELMAGPEKTIHIQPTGHKH